MSITPPAPPVSDALLDYLKHLFPNACPRLGTSFEHVWYQAGQHAVVAHLQAVAARQREKSLNTG